MLFDNASRQNCSVKTSTTNTPLHALTTMNDVTFLEAARVMAANVLQAANNDESRLEVAYELVTSRKPESDELEILIHRLDTLKIQYAELPDEALALIRVGEFPVLNDLEVSEHAAYAALCSALLNLDETITRQ
jgi:hypothetical protein